MSTPTYVILDNLPAPVTSGSGVQSFTDVLGDVWVAANGVNSGAWRRAVNVLHASYFRNAAFTVPTAYGILPYDTLVYDDYGLNNTSNGYITVPIAGFWRIFGVVSAVASAAAQTFWITITNTAGTTTYRQAAIVSGGTTTTARPVADVIVRATAGQQFVVQVQASAALGAQVAQAGLTMLLVDYIGTG